MQSTAYHFELELDIDKTFSKKQVYILFWLRQNIGLQYSLVTLVLWHQVGLFCVSQHENL